MLQFLDTPAATAAPDAMSGLMTFTPLLSLVVVFIIFYFMLIRPQKKRDKEIAKMRSNLQIGDEVVTRGGIVGIVVSIREDTLILETGNERSKIRILRGAVENCHTIHDDN